MRFRPQWLICSSMNGIAALQNRVRLKCAEREETRQRLADLDVELRVWQEALTLVSDPDAVKSAAAPAVGASQSPTPNETGDRRRGPRGTWRIVMPIAAKELGGEFGYSAVERVGTAAGTPINRHTLRSQMANYVNAGLLERVKEGTFRFTEKGKDEFKSLSTDSGSSELESERSDGDGA